jgi:hypothetical protein
MDSVCGASHQSHPNLTWERPEPRRGGTIGMGPSYHVSSSVQVLIAGEPSSRRSRRPLAVIERGNTHRLKGSGGFAPPISQRQSSMTVCFRRLDRVPSETPSAELVPFSFSAVSQKGGKFVRLSSHDPMNTFFPKFSHKRLWRPNELAWLAGEHIRTEIRFRRVR